jgi:ribose transport system permease protein
MAVPAATERNWLQTSRQVIADRPVIALAVILVALVIATNGVSPGFISAGSLSSIVLTAAALGVLGGGQTLVLLTGGIDLSIINTATAAAYVMAEYGSKSSTGAIITALVIGIVVGAVNGIGVGIFRVQPLIMTLGMSGIITGVLTVLSGGGSILGFKFAGGVPLVPSAIHNLGSGTISQIPGIGQYIPWNLVVVWIPLALTLMLGLRYSGLGRSIYAVGDNPVAAGLAGIRVWQVLLAAYTICGLLAAVAGLLLVGYTNAADLALAAPYLLPSVAAAVIGGTSILGGNGGYGGTIMGALILTVLDSMLTLLNASEAVRQILYGFIILALATIYTRLGGGE